MTTVPSAPVVRLLLEADAGAVCAIVDHYIRETTVNFRTAPQPPQEWLDDWDRQRERYPYLVAVIDGDVVGVAYAGPWKTRNAYDWCAETTVYVRAGLGRHGIGRALYRRLLVILDAQGFTTQVGVVALPNEASVRLHEAMGYRHAGTLRAVGHKLGRWCDVGLFQRVTPAVERGPRELLPVAEATSESR
jgi:phosphinothricin acetyltransferase